MNAGHLPVPDRFHDLAAPKACLLCGQAADTVPAGFRQIYRQAGARSLELPWWECQECRGWFVHPVPTPQQIERHCATAVYNRASHAADLSRAKATLQHRILTRLADRISPGPLLDFGCSFGEFLAMAARTGWTPHGFDPNSEAVAIAARNGWDVRCGWVLAEADFPEKHFAAVTAVDSFCLAWSPHDTLRTFHRLLQPGGLLAMRLTNKRAVLGLARACSRPGSTRDRRLSTILKGQFHSIGMDRLAAILERIGFDHVVVEPHATSAPWNMLPVPTRLAYGLSSLTASLTRGSVNVSPGVLLFARKSV